MKHSVNKVWVMYIQKQTNKWIKCVYHPEADHWRLRESNKAGLGWISTVVIIIHSAFSSHTFSSPFSPPPLFPHRSSTLLSFLLLFTISSFLYTFLLSYIRVIFLLLLTLFSSPPPISSVIYTLFYWSLHLHHISSFAPLFLISLSSSSLISPPCPIIPLLLSSFLPSSPLLPSPPLPHRLHHFPPERGQQRSARSSRARIYILIYQFLAAAEAVMDDVLPALQRCHELPWWLQAETATHWPLHHCDW